MKENQTDRDALLSIAIRTLGHLLGLLKQWKEGKPV